MNNNDLHFAKRLSDIIRFKTVSHTDESLINYNEFLGLHDYLEKTYPLVHKTFTREVVGKCSLIYHWKCTEPTDTLPIALLAHMDVVPEGDESKWTYPPFSGHIDDEFLWGRGTADIKANIIAHMETLEKLIETGFKPSYDIYLCYGENEELMGKGKVSSGAGIIVDTLYERGVKLGCVIDEGGSVIPGDSFGMKNDAAVIALAEKGYADIEISKCDAGGHSSTPGKSTALSDICTAAVNIQNNPFKATITDPVKIMLKTLAPYADKNLATLINNFDENVNVIENFMSGIPAMNATIRTTMALTMASASEQANILPEKATITLNSRILPGDNVDKVYNHIKEVVGENIDVNVVVGHNPSPISPLDSKELRLVTDLISKYFEDAVYVPIIGVGGTDARHYYKICDNVFRFSPFNFGEYTFSAHKVNERIPVKGLWTSVEFFTDFLKEYC